MKQYENFCISLSNLKEIYNYQEPYSIVIITGIAMLHKSCFEQSWKMIKAILKSHSYEESATSSPKTILKTAYKAGMIKNEELWLQALQERNNVMYLYNQNIALEIVTQTKDKFYDMFCELKEEIEKNWL